MRTRTPVSIAAMLGSLALAAPATADDVRISKSSPEGRQAANAALERVGGGTVFRIRRDDDDEASKRYRVDVRKGRWIYEVDVSARFRVTEVERERRRPGDDDGTADQGSGDA